MKFIDAKTNEEIINSFSLWRKHIDTLEMMTEEEFNEMSDGEKSWIVDEFFSADL